MVSPNIPQPGLLGPSPLEESLEVELRLLKACILAHAQYLVREVGAHGSASGTYGAGNDQMATRAIKDMRLRFPELIP